MNSINVRIQGETDWTSYNYEVDDLNRIINYSISMPKLAFELGQLLDGHPLNPLSTDKKLKISGLLSQYVANSEIYQEMLQLNLRSLFITTFRLEGNNIGYKTRIAGAISEDISNALVVSKFNTPSPLFGDTGMLILLKLIGSNANYNKDKYHHQSVAKLLLHQAKQMRNMIQIIRP